MKQVVWIISCYLYGVAAILLVILLLLVYLRGQVNHLPNPFSKKNLAYRQPAQARGILFGKKLSLLAYSPEQDEGHILVMGPSGTGKTSALLIPTLRSWQGTALVVDISGDISANVNTPNKIIFDPTAENCIPYDVFAYSTPESISNVKMNFFKVYDSFFGVVSGLGGKESLVLDFLVCAMQSGNNMYVGTMKKIAVNINGSKATVQRAMDSLADKGFVAMQLDGVWLINPSMVIKGNRSKEKVLMDKFILIQREYDEKRKARKNSKRKEADKEKAAA